MWLEEVIGISFGSMILTIDNKINHQLKLHMKNFNQNQPKLLSKKLNEVLQKVRQSKSILQTFVC